MKKFIVKAKAWFKTAGLRSVVYLVGGIAAKVFLSWNIGLGIGIGIFLADNWMTIRKLITTKADEFLK